MTRTSAVSPLGLTTAEAKQRLVAEGPNELPRPPRRTRWRIAAEIVREPMFGLLLAAAAVYAALGDPLEASILTAFAGLSVSIAIVQESRSERVLEALRDLASPRALVVRDSQPQRIAGRDVVRGDAILLGEGDRVPADAVLVSATGVQADESLLTGEAVPVRKVATATGAVPAVRPGGDDSPYVFAGSMIVRGQGTAVVQATGPRSEMGKIGVALQGIQAETPRLAQQTAGLVRTLAVAGLAVSALVVVLYGWLRGEWLDALLGGIAVSMSLLPEEFPLVLSVFLAMGAWRISRAGVLTRRAAAIEMLGAATVLCTDKTGTLTQNRMAVAELCIGSDVIRPDDDERFRLPACFSRLVEYAQLASDEAAVDPMDRAFHALAAKLAERQHPHQSLTLAHHYGLTPSLLAVTRVWKRRGGDGHIVAAKGAPEAIIGLCRLGADEAARVRCMIDDMARRGLRVLGVAAAIHPSGAWPDSPRGFAFQFIGLVGLADPLRPGVAAAVAECRSAGIRVVMITGDYPATARAIAAQAGLADSEPITGDQLAALTDDDLVARARSTSIFARIMPEQKLRIVAAFKRAGEIVGMTGDGVNDAPSLKAAHIGIAMGGRGTDVAREASSIVLLDDDFSSIVTTIRLGRRIYDNLRKAMGYIVAVHVPIAGLALLPLSLGWPLLLGPLHIAMLELLIDPVCSIVFEAEDDDRGVMDRPPRDPASPIFSPALIGWSSLQGVLAFALIGAVSVAGVWRGMPEAEVRALAFVSLVLTNVGLILVNRSFSASLWRALARRNPVIWWVLGGVGVGLGAVLALPPLRAAFHFGPLHADDLALTLAAGLGLLLLLESVKPLWRRRLQS